MRNHKLSFYLRVCKLFQRILNMPQLLFSTNSYILTPRSIDNKQTKSNVNAPCILNCHHSTPLPTSWTHSLNILPNLYYTIITPPKHQNTTNHKKKPAHFALHAAMPVTSRTLDNDSTYRARAGSRTVLLWWCAGWQLADDARVTCVRMWCGHSRDQESRRFRSFKYLCVAAVAATPKRQDVLYVYVYNRLKVKILLFFKIWFSERTKVYVAGGGDKI